MSFFGVNVAIIDGERVLLTKREDFEVRCLPGGEVDVGESVAEAALREAREETGLEVRLTRLVGIYSAPRWPRFGVHIVVFVAKPVGGSVRAQPAEVIDMANFTLDTLPEHVLLGHRRRILDALNGVSGIASARDTAWPFPPEVTRRELYELRDRSGLPRQEFYKQYLVRDNSEGERVEVGQR